jgi:7,8-dihydropterin-6-yl-methyl-4-(beta-D-ribofuranosyl)aminobenzene 5'-phosphate synthase
MIQELRITVLTDNYVAAPDLLAEHGLCLLIEADSSRILFDSGQSGVALRNAKALGVSLRGLDAVVLSHGHFDHTGGLADLLPECSPSTIYLHPAAFEPKYARGERPAHRQIGIPQRSRQAVEASGAKIVWTESATEVAPGVWCTGVVPRLPENDQATSGFFLDAERQTPDTLPDDQALFADTREGLAVIAGCAHSGVANTLEQICALNGRDEVFALMGGFHLGGAPRERLDLAARAIERRKCRVLAPCHCTGLAAQAYLRSQFPTLVRDVGVGTRLVLGGAKDAQ